MMRATGLAAVVVSGWLLLYARGQNLTEEEGATNRRLTPVTISGQAIYSTFPAWVAKEKGYFEQLGLNVTLRYYESGDPQVRDAANWDIGDAGCVPNIMGSQLGISTIAVSNDASSANALLGNRAGVAAWANLTDFTGVPVGISPNSTGHYVALRCLADRFPSLTDEAFIYDSNQRVIISGISGDSNISNYDFAAFWAPYMYTVLDDVLGSEVLCSGETSGTKVPSGIMVRDEFAQKNPKAVARILAAWMRAIGFLKNPGNRFEALELMEKFYEERGVETSSRLADELDTRSMFTLNEQLELMERQVDDEGVTTPSEVDAWYAGVRQFMLDTGVLGNFSSASEYYITDHYLWLVSIDPVLGWFANAEIEVPSRPPPDAEQDEPLDGGILVRISGQPIYSTLPAWIAHKRGYFKELGLRVTFEYYPSGAPQVAANQTWDIGDAGCVPNILGSLRGISTIAISNDASTANALIGNLAGARAWNQQAADLGSVPVGVTPNSTGHYVALRCLTQTEGFVFKPQLDIITGMSENLNEFDYGAFWPPFLYTALNGIVGSDLLCSGESAGVKVPSGIMVRDEFAEENPQVVAMVLAAWMRAIGFLKNPDNRLESEALMKDFYEERGVLDLITTLDLSKELELRPMFTLDEQLSLFNRPTEGPSEADLWYSGVSEYMTENGILSDVPPENEYLTDKFLKLVDANETLRDFSNQENPAPDQIPISLQHSSFSSLPGWIAKEWGFFEQLGLNVGIVYNSPGVRQIEQLIASNAWVADAGVITGMLGAQREEFSIVAITNDEAATTALMANAEGVREWPPEDLSGVVVGITHNSSGHLVVIKCLQKEYSDAWVDAERPIGKESDIISGMTPDHNGVSQIEYGALQAPQLYVAERAKVATVICNGSDVNLIIPGGLVVPKKKAEENPMTVAALLAAWMRGIAVIKNPGNKQDVLREMQHYNSATGTNLEVEDLEKEIRLRSLFDFDEQLKIMRREYGADPSQVDGWYEELRLHLSTHEGWTGILSERDYITDEFLRLVYADESLRAFAMNSELGDRENGASSPSPTPAAAAADDETTTSGGLPTVYSSRPRLLLMAGASLLAHVLVLLA